MSKKVIVNILLFVLAIFLTITTVYRKVEVFDKSELNNLSCGWPIHYLSSGYETSRYDPPYPWKANCVGLAGGGWGDPVDICWGCFTFNVAFFYLLILVSYYSGDIIVKRMQKKKQDRSNIP